MTIEDKPIAQLRALTVLARIQSLIVNDPDGYLEGFVDGLENMLNELNHCDFFGSEGSTDPRGDFRNGEFSLNDYIEGVDT